MKKFKTIGFKFITTAEFMDDGRIRFNINKFNFKASEDCYTFAREMCEIITDRFNRVIRAQHLSINYYCIDYDSFKNWEVCGFNCLSYVDKEIISIVYDPICGYLYIETE